MWPGSAPSRTSGKAGNETQEAQRITADKVWLYVTILTVGYMISRGLAKSGSRDPWGRPDDHSERNGRESRWQRTE